MGLFDGCLLTSDIDLTLMVNGIIPARNREAIDRFREEGGLFTVATGRAAQAAKPAFDFITCNCPAIVYNGGMIYDYRNQKVLYERALSPRDCGLFLRLSAAFPDLGAEVYSGDEVFVINQTDKTDWHIAYERMEPSDRPVEELSTLPWHKALFMLNCAEDFDRLDAALPDFPFADSHFIRTSAADDGEMIYIFEQLPNGVSKGTALSRLAELTGARPGRVFAIGDYDNDAEMLAAADFSAAPAGASEPAKRQADLICGPCQDGAVADFIEAIARRLAGA